MVCITLDVKDLQETAKRINDELGPGAVNQALGVALGRTKQFAVDTVAQMVSALYNISEGEVKSTNTKGAAVGVNLSVGVGEGSIAEITFSGRVLTLAHFEFSPHSPPRGKYTVTGTIYSGSTKALGGNNVFVPRSGAITRIPFKRTGKRSRSGHKEAIEAIRTVSIPQMVSNEQLEEPIREAVSERLIEEFAKHFDKGGGAL